jgi:hypothetical protein
MIVDAAANSLRDHITDRDADVGSLLPTEKLYRQFWTEIGMAGAGPADNCGSCVGSSSLFRKLRLGTTPSLVIVV